MDPADDKSMLGKTVGGCRLEGRIGSGATGAVYKASQLSMQRPVAVKFLSRRIAAPVEAELFMDEVRILGHINHPNVIRIYTAGVHEGVRFFVMELLEGESLQAHLKREGRLPADISIPVALDICRGLEAVHSKGIVHRDIKPSNVFLRNGAPPKLFDFGTAHPGGSDASEYMAPEQWKREKVDARTDLYALGIVLYRAVMGRNPFTGDAAALRQAHLTKQPAFDPRPEDLSDSLRAVILKLTRKDPNDRYEKSADVIADLMRVDGGQRPLAADDLRGKLMCPVCDTPNVRSREKCSGCGEPLSRIQMTTNDLLPDDAVPDKPPPAGNQRPDLRAARRPRFRRRS